VARVFLLLPGVLREHAGGAGRLELRLPDGRATLGGVLDIVAGAHPALERRLRDERGVLRRYVNFFVDGEECRCLAGQDTPVRDGAELQVIPSIAGG
jgi:molybdopterin converting factor small subunit